ncbi:C40 family peptidase [Paenibacillus massiliensis]|uniref:C40 family peptidase n=1 Tax=Paenibacillus massiliensis TaxID=225917 RepID=UPI00040E1707|nr:C40 family peptidase [Paenibacillus massiliensis]
MNYRELGRWMGSTILGTALLLSVAGCMDQAFRKDLVHTSSPVAESAQLRLAGKAGAHKLNVYKDQAGRVWVPLQPTVQAMNMKLHQTGDHYIIGATDPNYTVQMNTPSARTGDQTVELPHAPRMLGGTPHLTVQAMSALLNTPMHWDASRASIVVEPQSAGTRIRSKSLPGLPYSGADGRMGAMSRGGSNLDTEAEKQELISYGKKFMGTPYEFGAGDYSDKRTFDCSSFVQYVFSHFGVELPRTSISQAGVGRRVQLGELKTGDLLFFYTPGRYDSNNTVGHVGIYAGNNRILQTYGDPGVTMSELDDYWKGRFLFARRVLD